MSGIVSPLTDVISKLATLAVVNQDKKTAQLYARVWNNQFQLLQAGQIEAFPLPCAFVEVVAPNKYNQLGGGITESDITFRIHLGMEQLDTGDGTMEQNLKIFALRDSVITLLTYFEPTACSPLMHTVDEQDYYHSNMYHYILSFICSYIDKPGDQTVPQIDYGPPTNLVLDIDYDKAAPLDFMDDAFNVATCIAVEVGKPAITLIVEALQKTEQDAVAGKVLPLVGDLITDYKEIQAAVKASKVA